MLWCEGNAVGYVLGLPKNSRLVKELARERAEAKAVYN